MKIEIRKIVQPLQLSDYAPEYDDARLMVWVNPPKGLLETRTELAERANGLKRELQNALKLSEAETPMVVKDAVKGIAEELAGIGHEMVTWLATIWSQGEPETQFSAEELQEFILEAEESDPAFYVWLVDQTLLMIYSHRARQKKS
jgi:hypothetical protein